MVYVEKTKIIFAIAAGLALIAFSVYMLSRDDGADRLAAETFINQYYTVNEEEDNLYTTLMDIYWDDSGTQIQADAISAVIEDTYGELMTFDAMQSLMADRSLYAPDELAASADLTITCTDVTLTEKSDTSQEDNDYDYSASVYVENAYGNFTEVVLEGVIQLSKEDDSWKITGFYPNDDFRTMPLELKRPEQSSEIE